jgi:protein-ribulosamine 3-kinase
MSYLVLEYVEFGKQAERASATFGGQLAELHRVNAPRFGWYRDNTIGSTPQRNTYEDSWVVFWREHRLGFQLQLAIGNGSHGPLIAKLEQVLEGIPTLLAGHDPQPALLHGDLWAGNFAADISGRAVIYDPAVYYGDRETDLAMTELFGGFGPRFYHAYKNEYPIMTGYDVRRTLYNLYHVLNHVNLFGGGYARQAERMTDELLSELR